MIPTIEQICDDLKAGNITLEKAITWLLIHFQNSDEGEEHDRYR